MSGEADKHVTAMSTSNLVIDLQKLAKKIDYHRPWYRARLLEEAALRLTRYRQAELEGRRP